MRLADVGEGGQVKLCAAKVSPSGEAFAAEIESRYLAAAGIVVTHEKSDATFGAEVDVLPDLGLRYPAPREVGDGALRALASIRAILGAGS